MATAGLPVDECWVRAGEYETERAGQAAHELLASGDVAGKVLLRVED